VVMANSFPNSTFGRCLPLVIHSVYSSNIENIFPSRDVFYPFNILLSTKFTCLSINIIKRSKAIILTKSLRSLINKLHRKLSNLILNAIALIRYCFAQIVFLCILCFSQNNCLLYLMLCLDFSTIYTNQITYANILWRDILP